MPEPAKKSKTTESFLQTNFRMSVSRLRDFGKSNFLTPKILIRLSPGSMRQEDSGSRLNPTTAFNINRINEINNYETGVSSTIGFDYKVRKGNNDSDFDLSIAQVINEKENKKMADKTSMNEKQNPVRGPFF